MWFPPYDISFTDNTSVNWETTQFIGRAEPIYTYNNTERTGTLQFKIIADHPTMLNDLRFTDKKYQIEDILAGCKELPQDIKLRLTDAEKAAIEIKTALTRKNQTKAKPITIEVKGSVFFPNAVYNLTRTDWDDYETTTGYPLSVKEDSAFGDHIIIYPISNQLNSTPYPNGVSWVEMKNPANDKLKEIIDLCDKKSLAVEIKGYASKTGIIANESLANNRAKELKEFFIARFTALGLSNPAQRVKILKTEVLIVPLISDYTAQAVSKEDIEARKCDFTLKYSPELDDDLKPAPDNTPDIIDDAYEGPTLKTSFAEPKFINEAEYFFKLQDINKFVYDDIRQKLRWFHPAFHSTTPEGLNSRLTFLQQCGRQGSTSNANGNPDNLAFGRPPVCILRIGDFYHTKIVIDSINFSYEPLVWDLNPEGIGVQPMIVTVDLNFKFIGGSALNGPINRLQNAVSFNFFANNEVYSKRPDYIRNGELQEGYKKGSKLDINEVDVNNTTTFPDVNLATSAGDNQTASAAANSKQQDPVTTTSDVKIDFTLKYSDGEITGILNGTPELPTLPQGTWKILIDSKPTDLSTTIDLSSIATLEQSQDYELSDGNHEIEVSYIPNNSNTQSKMKLNLRINGGVGNSTGKLTIIDY
jgi:hypothetical protein